LVVKLTSVRTARLVGRGVVMTANSATAVVASTARRRFLGYIILFGVLFLLVLGFLFLFLHGFDGRERGCLQRSQRRK
jgi:hypothetical protein